MAYPAAKAIMGSEIPNFAHVKLGYSRAYVTSSSGVSVAIDAIAVTSISAKIMYLNMVDMICTTFCSAKPTSVNVITITRYNATYSRYILRQSLNMPS